MSLPHMISRQLTPFSTSGLSSLCSMKRQIFQLVPTGSAFTWEEEREGGRGGGGRGREGGREGGGEEGGGEGGRKEKGIKPRMKYTAATCLYKIPHFKRCETVLFHYVVLMAT